VQPGCQQVPGGPAIARKRQASGCGDGGAQVVVPAGAAVVGLIPDGCTGLLGELPRYGALLVTQLTDALLEGGPRLPPDGLR